MRHILLLPALVLALAGCGDNGRLADELGKTYGIANVTYETADSTRLRVSFFNSPFAERPDSARAGTARKVAEHVRDHFPRYKALDKVTVEFLTRKETEAGGKNVAARYSFSRAALGDPRS
jgi:hypothetical protein